MHRLSLFGVLLLSFFLIACSGGEIKDDIVINQSESSEAEAFIIDTLTNESAHWEITIYDETIQNIKVMIDHYRFGEKQKPVAELSTMVESKKGGTNIRLIFAEQVFQGETKWITAFIDDFSVASLESTSPITEDMQVRSYSSVSFPETAKKGEKVAIGTIIYTDSDNETSISTPNVYDEFFDENELKNYNDVFIFSLETN